MSLKKKKENKYFRSIKFRLVSGYAVIVLATVLALSFYFYILMNRNLLEISREYLRDALNTAVSLAETESLDQPSLIEFLSEYMAVQKGPRRISYALFDNKGFLLAGSKNFMEDQKSVDTLKEMQGKIQQDNVYETSVKDNQGKNVILITGVFQQGMDGEQFFIQFGVDPLGDREAMKTMLKTFMTAVPAVLLFVISGGFILTGRMLAQVSNLAEAARSLSLTDKSSKLPLSGTGDELDQLAEEFNSVYGKLRESYRRIAGFTADASHELRLPITAIKGEAEVVLESERGLEEYQRVLQGIIEEMDNLTRMISRLLMLARADSGREQLLREEIDMKNLVEKIVEFYKPLAESKEISISFSSQGSGNYLQADKLKLQQAFSNLIENAIKYNVRNGKITVNLTVSAENCRLAISDTGIGIAGNEQEKIFERFYRVDKSRSRSEGSAGLGLSIADMIVKEHNGRITIESEPGKGSRFTVNIPVS
jgi:heavy metal sensor kinase